MHGDKTSKYLVIGPPRGGFTLLLSVLSILYRDKGKRKRWAQEIADPYIAVAGEYLDAAVRDYFHGTVGQDRLFFNKEFSILVGGPKWISNDDPHTVCVRKYLGIKGEGDFTFILYLPRWVLAFDEIVHSHSHPARWLEMPDYADFRKFASIRNPIDIIHSSVFSINALASEYIQRELKLNEHEIRRELALNKLTNPPFIAGLITFLKKYLDEFIPVAERFDYLMRWEDLIQAPAEEIQKIAEIAGEPVEADHASRIWTELEYRNLTRYHKHSFRKGVLDDWMLNITNTHLKLFEEAGMAYYLEKFGYDPIRYFDESTYTPDQKLIEEHIRQESPYVENLDKDIITFAFNKTNFIPSAKFVFRHYPRQGCVEIEKSTMKDEDLANGFMARISGVTDTVYRYLQELRDAAEHAAAGSDAQLADLRTRYVSVFSEWLGEQAETMLSAAADSEKHGTPPQLAGSISGCNIVYFKGFYYIVPQSLGPMDFSTIDLTCLPEGVSRTILYSDAEQIIKRTIG